MSVDSCTVDTEDWQGADSCTIGDVGGGLLGSEMVVGGFLHGDLTLPDDANKEICGRITYLPPGLDLRTDEDGGLTAAANDGTYVAQYQLYVDYVATGPVTPLTYTFGAISIAAAWTEGAESFAAAGTVSAPAITATLGWTEGSEAFSASGTATAPAISAAIGWTEGAEAFAATGIASAPNTVSCAIGWVEGSEAFAVTGTALGYFTATAAWVEGAESLAAAGAVAAPSIAAILGWTEGAETTAMAGIVINPITAAAAWTEGSEGISVAAVGPVTIAPNTHQIHIGSPRARLYTGGQLMSFRPKRAAEVEIFAVDYMYDLAPDETILSAEWSITAVDGVDVSASGMIRGTAQTIGTVVCQKIGGGLPGMRYAPICTAQTSLGQTLVLPEYGQGQLEITL